MKKKAILEAVEVIKVAEKNATEIRKAAEAVLNDARRKVAATDAEKSLREAEIFNNLLSFNCAGQFEYSKM